MHYIKLLTWLLSTSPNWMCADNYLQLPVSIIKSYSPVHKIVDYSFKVSNIQSVKAVYTLILVVETPKMR